jgi:glutathione peroxidase
MRTLTLAAALVALVLVVKFSVAADAPPAASQPASSPLDYKVKDIDGNDYDLAQLKGKVVLLVNVASKCGYTPQYTGLEKLYESKKDQGFVIVGFPANNFKGQEPGTNEQIKEFCTSKYNVTFPMMSKISVKGDDIHPLYKQLTDAKGQVTWNFNKFLIGKDGKLIEHFDSKAKPDDAKLTDAIDKALAAQG